MAGSRSWTRSSSRRHPFFFFSFLSYTFKCDDIEKLVETFFYSYSSTRGPFCFLSVVQTQFKSGTDIIGWPACVSVFGLSVRVTPQVPPAHTPKTLIPPVHKRLVGSSARPAFFLLLFSSYQMATTSFLCTSKLWGS